MPCESKENIGMPKKPSEMHIQVSNAIITNCFAGESVKPNGLKDLITSLIDKELFKNFKTVGDILLDPLPTQTDTIRKYFLWLAEYLNSDQENMLMNPSSPERETAVHKALKVCIAV